MKLPGSLENRLGVLSPARYRLHSGHERILMEDAGIRVECSLEGTTQCIHLRLKPDDIQFLREGKCADFALLLARDNDEFEAHIVEHKRAIGKDEWERVQKQLEWALVRLLAIAGVVGIRIEGVVVYTVFCNDKLSREGSSNPAIMKVPVGEAATRWTHARRSWERAKVHLEVFDRDVDHFKIQTAANGLAAVVCEKRTLAESSTARWTLVAKP